VNENEYIARYSESDTTQNINRHEYRNWKKNFWNFCKIIQNDTNYSIEIYSLFKINVFSV
jgi:hypothetical protein